MPQKKVFDGKLIKLYAGEKALPDGRKGYFEEIRHPGAALVVPFLGNKIVFIQQYRAVIDEYLWEVPAGTLNPGETPLACAKREVSEETGYRIKKIKRLGAIHTTPGFCNEIIHIFRADCGKKGAHKRDTDEFIKIFLLPKNKIRKLFKTGRIHDSKTIAALAFAGIL